MTLRMQVQGCHTRHSICSAPYWLFPDSGFFSSIRGARKQLAMLVQIMVEFGCSKMLTKTVADNGQTRGIRGIFTFPHTYVWTQGDNKWGRRKSAKSAKSNHHRVWRNSGARTRQARWISCNALFISPEGTVPIHTFHLGSVENAIKLIALSMEELLR